MGRHINAVHKDQQKNYECEVCGKFFDKSFSLKNHIVSVHGSAVFKTYQNMSQNKALDKQSKKERLKETPLKSENLTMKIKMEPKVKEEIIDTQQSQNYDLHESFVGIKSE